MDTCRQFDADKSVGSDHGMNCSTTVDKTDGTVTGQRSILHQKGSTKGRRTIRSSGHSSFASTRRGSLDPYIETPDPIAKNVISNQALQISTHPQYQTLLPKASCSSQLNFFWPSCLCSQVRCQYLRSVSLPVNGPISRPLIQFSLLPPFQTPMLHLEIDSPDSRSIKF